ncbi:MAG TPA: methyltransferase domain-containing protein, partial [Kofleriaceae bacterium]
MTLDLLICPGCRTLSGDRLDVQTLERTGDLLVCECGRRYPIVDDVPIVLSDPSSYIRNEIATIVERDLSPEVSALLVAPGPDEAAYPRMLEHLSIYLDAHWGDRALPSPAVHPSDPEFALAPFVERIAALPRVGMAVELGCSVGRVLAELPAERAIGIDMHFGAVRRARRLLAGEALPYARREIGRHYSSVTATGKATSHRKLVCADVLDPPVLPDVFDRVIALNMLDSVAHPRQLLSVVDGLCAFGGEIILSSPYAWQSSVVHDHERFGGADPAAALRDLLTSGTGLRGRYQLEDEAEIAWTLRRDARSAVTYRTHYLRARKGT